MRIRENYHDWLRDVRRKWELIGNFCTARDTSRGDCDCLRVCVYVCVFNVWFFPLLQLTVKFVNKFLYFLLILILSLSKTFFYLIN